MPMAFEPSDKEEIIQSLWGGYGRLVRRRTPNGPIIVKDIRWHSGKGDASHRRKLRSYQEESHWYAHWAARVPMCCRIPCFLGVESKSDGMILELEDLDAAGFPRRSSRLRGDDLHGAIAWLATFHAAFLGVAPDGLWEEGSYWHLGTRREEYAAMPPSRLRTLAPELDRRLSKARFRTIIHGDAKPDNFCLGAPGKVAMVDFQYVGGGCGMRDLAYLIDCVFDEAPEGRRTADALDTYFGILRDRLRADARHAPLAEAVEAEWRELYPVAWMDYQRFLEGWRRG
ncbi:MAG: aminoglycoside phosphotransferase family protein [Fibrobacteres bacterium]|nr:aminoglycoside phosphotransferase family protein [Fibrobacterota bacterium]